MFLFHICMMQASLHIAAVPPALVADLLTNQPLVLNLSFSGHMVGSFRCVIGVSSNMATVQLNPAALPHLVFAVGDGWGNVNMDFQIGTGSPFF